MKATGDGPGEARLRAADVSDAMTRDREGCTRASVSRLRRSSPAVSRAKRRSGVRRSGWAGGNILGDDSLSTRARGEHCYPAHREPRVRVDTGGAQEWIG